MFRTTDTVLIAVMEAAAAFTYNIKHRVEGQRLELRRTEAAIRFEADTMTILRADWSLLTQPARLQKLTEIYKDELQLAPLEPRQIVGVEEVPERLLDIDTLLEPDAGVVARNGTDATTTGAVGQ